MAGRIKPVGGGDQHQRPSRQVVKPSSGKLPMRLRFLLWLIIGIAATAGAGYLVAALVFFPAPLLPSEREVPPVTGLSALAASRELQRQSLSDSVEGHEPDPVVAVGSVVWQDPPAGVAVPRGTMVNLVLSSGPPVLTVPDVRGYDAEIAQRLLKAAGFRVDGIDSVDVKDVPSGLAGGTTPAAGEHQPLGRALTLHLAR